MTKPIAIPNLYDKRIPIQLSFFTELIVEVYNQYPNFFWSNDSHNEIGFYEKDKITKSEIFLGIWYESWQFFEIPLCIAIDYRGKARYEQHQKFKKYIEDKKIKGLILKDYLEYSLILFEHNFFNYENDPLRIINLFKDVSNFMRMNHKMIL